MADSPKLTDAELLAFAKQRLRRCISRAIELHHMTPKPNDDYNHHRQWANEWATIVLALQSMVKPAVPSAPGKRKRELQLDEMSLAERLTLAERQLDGCLAKVVAEARTDGDYQKYNGWSMREMGCDH
jgi:hypothetical protein